MLEKKRVEVYRLEKKRVELHRFEKKRVDLYMLEKKRVDACGSEKAMRRGVMSTETLRVHRLEKREESI